MSQKKHRKDWSRAALRNYVDSLVKEDKAAHQETNPTSTWIFTPQLALKIVEQIFEEHPRKSGRLTKEHMYIVGGYNPKKQLIDFSLSKQDQIKGIFHDLFEDTSLEARDASDWGVEPSTVHSLHRMTRTEYKVLGMRQKQREPYCDYIEILGNKLEDLKIKRKDTIDNARSDEKPQLTGKKLTKKLVTLSYIDARLDNTISAGTPFMEFATTHKNRLPIEEGIRTFEDITKWIHDNSSIGRSDPQAYRSFKM